MARLVLCVVALLVAGGFADPTKKALPQKIADPVFLQKQLQLSELFYHIHEPVFIPDQLKIVESWDIEKSIEHYTNVTAVKIFGELWENGLLPRAVPFTILNPDHRFEAVTLFNVLYSAKDYDTFYKTAVFFRQHINEGVFVYVLSAAILHRHDTQGLIVPPIYEIFPSFFHNGEIMTTAQRLNTHGISNIEHFPSTFVWNDNIVIRWNETVWPYVYEDSLAYFTNDHELNTYYYNMHLTYPFWLGGETCPLVKDRRGEWFWFVHKQIVARYYLERLSNGQTEIPELGTDVVQHGYWSGLLHHNGIPYPVRPNHYHLLQPHLVDELTEIDDYERRIRDAIDRGYVETVHGERIDIRTPEAIDVLGNIIEANVDSPNTQLYKDFVTLWKVVLGNSVVHDHVEWYQHHVPLVLPSVLEQYQTSLRDPAFYMIWKRVLNLFTYWQRQLPLYKPEELALPSVKIQKVEVDKLVTYFEHSYVNVTNHLHLTKHERTGVVDEVSVLVQRPQLNHKVYQVRVNVKSEAAKTVVVRLFLAPKYDSRGYEIPLHQNTENFVLLDQWTHDLPVGDSVIKRDSNENVYMVEHWPSHVTVYEEAENAVHGKGQFVLDQTHRFNGFPQRLALPRGRVGGMPFVLVVYISEYRAPKVPYGTGFDPALSLGVGSGAVRMTDDPLGYPFNRPVHYWQVRDLHNFWIQDVTIYHKPTPEIDVPYTE
ncbi:acidic juvenile hormone-suppressible protein 1-like [Pectinophora gossypiella]|uniref:acidic juvenile hormone-suppressible protein 1-like n=1 Tax=Pectinophora gossypiella TaxID=13191 RepID=UPI00214E8215|nr:acidic juvenile hormone-suppressible protein 1-like [Pectinophora gossypiella]